MRTSMNGHKGAARDTGRGAARGVMLAAVACLLCMFVPPASAWSQEAPAAARAYDLAGGRDWTGYETQPLRVNLWHGGQGDIYRRGESIDLAFESNQDAYAVVYRIDTEGEVTILWPRTRMDDGFIFGRHQYRLPAAGAPRLRASSAAGIEYVQAVVSAYPFDLRRLEVDFHHEVNEYAYRFRVAGDPFLAMNEVNYAVTGLDNPEDFVVTNYLSYYVERQVAHPRYLCGQCHAGDPVYDPYSAACSINIHYDHGWANRWYVRFGYYPVYYYPAYYYVDPWTWRPWINYWYTPWYWWPSVAIYDWPYSFYVWNYSPYWQGDIWERWKSGERRYAPLDKRYLDREAERNGYLERRNLMVQSGKPSRDMRQAMESRTKLTREAAPARGQERAGQVAYQNVRPLERTRADFGGGGGGAVPEPGLRVRDRTPDRGRVLTVPGGERDTPEARPTRPGGERGRDLRSRDGSDSGLRREGEAGGRPGGDGGAIRPVEPRSKGQRIWSGGRAPTAPERAVRPAPEGRQPSVRERGDDQRGGRGTLLEDRSRSGADERIRPAPQTPRPAPQVRERPAPRADGGGQPPQARPAPAPSRVDEGRGSGGEGGSARSTPPPAAGAGSRSKSGRGTASGI